MSRLHVPPLFFNIFNDVIIKIELFMDENYKKERGEMDAIQLLQISLKNV